MIDFQFRVYFLRAEKYQGTQPFVGLSDCASFSSSSGILVDSSMSTSLQIVMNLRDPLELGG